MEAAQGVSHPVDMRFLLLLCVACSGVIGEPGDPARPHVEPGDLAPSATSGFRRLSPDELLASLEDLVGALPNGVVDTLKPFESAPFDNDYTTQTASLQLVRAYSQLADAVATQVLTDVSRRDALVGCTPTGAGDIACARQFVASFGRRAFRRSLTDDEIEEFVALQSFAAEAETEAYETGYAEPFYAGIHLIMTAILQDVEFLYWVEAGESAGETRRLAPHEIATRMAMLLWGSAPDEALIAAAEDGELTTNNGRRRIADAMLDDTRAARQWARFHSMWLGYRQLTIPNATREMLRRETDALLTNVIFEEQRSYLDVFLADGTFLNRELGEHYNGLIDADDMVRDAAVPVPDSDELEWVDYGESGRRGILSHGSVLASFGKFEDTSPTQRGLFIRTRLLCQNIPSPPADLGVNTDNPPTATSPDACKIDAYEQHRSDPECASCHQQLDPVGFGLEQFDNQGRWRSHEAGRPECAIDGTGAVSGVGEFRGPGELAQRLVETGELTDCFSEHLLRFQLGRDVGPADAETLRWLRQTFEDNDFNFRETLVDWVASDAFTYRGEEN